MSQVQVAASNENDDMPHYVLSVKRGDGDYWYDESARPIVSIHHFSTKKQAERFCRSQYIQVIENEVDSDDIANLSAYFTETGKLKRNMRFDLKKLEEIFDYITDDASGKWQRWFEIHPYVELDEAENDVCFDHSVESDDDGS